MKIWNIMKETQIELLRKQTARKTDELANLCPIEDFDRIIALKSEIAELEVDERISQVEDFYSVLSSTGFAQKKRIALDLLSHHNVDVKRLKKQIADKTDELANLCPIEDFDRIIALKSEIAELGVDERISQVEDFYSAYYKVIQQNAGRYAARFINKDKHSTFATLLEKVFAFMITTSANIEYYIARKTTKETRFVLSGGDQPLVATGAQEHAVKKNALKHRFVLEEKERPLETIGLDAHKREKALLLSKIRARKTCTNVVKYGKSMRAVPFLGAVAACAIAQFCLTLNAAMMNTASVGNNSMFGHNVSSSLGLGLNG